MTDLEEKIVSGGNLEIKENSLVVRLQQIQKIEDQQKRYQDLEKKAESKDKRDSSYLYRLRSCTVEMKNLAGEVLCCRFWRRKFLHL